MTPGDDEDRLRAAFTEAHRADAGQTPRFEGMWASARRRSGPRRTPWRWAALSMGVAAGAVGLWLVGHPKPPPPWPVVGLRWTGPTDFLLDTPDLITLRTLPALDPGADPWTARPPAPRGNP